jgi:hypothetical protein
MSMLGQVQQLPKGLAAIVQNRYINDPLHFGVLSMSQPDLPEPQPPSGQLLIYQDGGSKLQVRLDGQTVWLTQAAMAELYQTTKQNVSLHLQNIFDDRELQQSAFLK